jgi:hypothetical protein
MATDDDTGEALYRWTIRGLYVVAIGLNVWVLWDQVRDTPEGEAIRSRAASYSEIISRPIRERTHFRRAANRVIFEAMTVVSDEQGDDDG